MKALLWAMSFALLLGAPFFGATPLEFEAIRNDATAHYLFWQLRIPRVADAYFVGGILSLGGLIFQSIFRNPMATPYTLGTAASATLFAAFSIVIGAGAFIELFAFAGALSSIVILLSLYGFQRRTDTASLLLAGIALSFFYSAALMLLFYRSDLHQSFEIMRFTMGALDTVGYGALAPLLIGGAILLVSAFWQRRSLSALSVSHHFALAKGYRVKRTLFVLLGSVSLAVGIAVSIAGPVGFIGLIVPHTVKRLYRKPSASLFLPVFHFGGVFLVVCDTVARSGTTELPVGIVTAFVGAPFFLYLLLRLGVAKG
jgi:iron complex transport system permease protein